MERHIATWPRLRPGESVSGGVLIVNHQHKLHPSERAVRVYSRPEFVDALTVAVISTVELFNWWRTGDWASVRAAVLGAELPAAGFGPTSPASRDVPADPTPTRAGRWRRWRRSCVR
jgi:hypothetical protein